MLLEILAKHYPNDSFQFTPLRGGDINEVYRATSQKHDFCVKINDAERLPRMFEGEAHGLNLLAQSTSLRIPKVIETSVYKGKQYLILEFVPAGERSKEMWHQFGLGLASLHQRSADQFGLDRSNYIGSLVQQNQRTYRWAEFLATQRFEPMLKMAMDKGHIKTKELAQFSKFERFIEEIWPMESPALLHGDLWSGNFLPAEGNQACLIDPAVYYGHREMDLGMMQLFGGFDNHLFDTYNEEFPLETGWQDRIPYNQLYPLLVHLNLFGRSYWSGIERIIEKF